MSSETVKQLWVIFGTVITAVLGWIGYGLKAKVDIKKELLAQSRKAEEANKLEREKLRKELDDKLGKIPALAESQRIICENQIKIEDSLNRIIDINISQEERLESISEGLLIALDSCLEQNKVLEENGLMTSELSRRYKNIEDFEQKLKANALNSKNRNRK